MNQFNGIKSNLGAGGQAKPLLNLPGASRTQNRTKARTTYQQQAPSSKLGSAATRQIVTSQGNNFYSPRLDKQSIHKTNIPEEDESHNGAKLTAQARDKKSVLDSGAAAKKEQQLHSKQQQQTSLIATNRLKKPTKTLSSAVQKVIKFDEKTLAGGRGVDHRNNQNDLKRNTMMMQLSNDTPQQNSGSSSIYKSPKMQTQEGELSPIQNEADAMKPQSAQKQQREAASQKQSMQHSSIQQVNSNMESGSDVQSVKTMTGGGSVIQQNKNTKQQMSGQMVKERSTNKEQEEDDDDIIDDLLDDSMELQESNTIASSSKTYSKTSSAIKGDKSNKVYSSSPSKLNDKFSHSGKPQQQKNAKQQDLKQSAIHSKKTLQSLQEQSKPLAQLELNMAMCSLAQINLLSISNINLRSIDFRSNVLVELPTQLFQLENLWKLQLDNNQIQGIPAEVQGLKQLKIFTISQNQIDSFPEGLLELGESLEKLDISSNKMSTIPSKISRLTKMKWLFIQNNPICSIPLSISQLVNLQQFGFDWFLYLAPLCESIIKKQDSQQQSDQIIEQILDILKQESSKTIGNDSQISFIEFLGKFYKVNPSTETLFTQTFMSSSRRSTIMHTLCRHNHSYLLGQLVRYKSLIDINQADTIGETPLMTALNEKNEDIIKYILNEFSDRLDFGQDYASILESASPTKKQQLLHPLMIAVKRQMLQHAVSILEIMTKQVKRITNVPDKRMNTSQNKNLILDLNIKDENKNSLMHHLFINFSSNMELSVELCQQLLKLSETYQSSQIKSSNTVTKPLLRLNDINKQGSTPIDLAVDLKQNQALEFAIYYNKNLLPAFSSPKLNKFDLNCNKNSRGIAPIHRAIIAQNYKAIFLLLSSEDCNLFIKDKEFKSAKDYCNKVLFLSKYIRKGENNYVRQYLHERGLIQQNHKKDPVTFKTLMAQQKAITHHNINIYQLGKRHNRVKYNSWYSRLENKNMLSSNQQPTLEQYKEGGQTGNDGDDELEEVRLEDMKEMATGSGGEFVEDEEPPKASVGSDQMKSLLGIGVGGHKSQSSSIIERQYDSQLSLGKPQSQNKTGVLKGQSQGDTLIKQSQMLQTGNNKSRSSQILQQHQQPQLLRQSIVDLNQMSPLQEGGGASYVGSMLEMGNQINEAEEGDDLQDAGCEENDEENDEEEDNGETPAVLLNNQSKYVMNVNSSKLARKPYYKHLQKNRFEADFCYIMDQRQPHSGKLQKLYQLYSIVRQNQNDAVRDGRELLTFLKIELEAKDENIVPLKNEILYFQELLAQTVMLADAHSNGGTSSQRANTTNTRRQNKNRSLERGPLPCIEETTVEYNNQNVSPIKRLASLEQGRLVNQRGQNQHHLDQLPPPATLINPVSQNRLQQNNYNSSSSVIEEIPLQTAQQYNRLSSSASKKSLENGGNKPIGMFKIQNMAKTQINNSTTHDSKISADAYQSNQSQHSTKSNHQQTTSPRANSGQIRSKAQAYAKKDMFVKKIEVQIIQDSSASIGNSINSQHQTSHSLDSSVKQQNQPQTKWRGLTINPNAIATIHGGSKINSTTNKTSTPQSQKTNIQNSTIQATTISLSNSGMSSYTKSGFSNLNQAQSKQNNSSINNHQVNRSNSNPRNSSITGNLGLKLNSTSANKTNTEELKSNQSHSFGSPVTTVTQKQQPLGSTGPTTQQQQSGQNLSITTGGISKLKPQPTKANSFRAAKATQIKTNK